MVGGVGRRAAMIRCFVDSQVFSEETDNLSICKYFVHLQVFGDYSYSYVENSPQFSGFANI